MSTNTYFRHYVTQRVKHKVCELLYELSTRCFFVYQSLKIDNEK